jgi:transcriptional regulator with XRE-family HTH domain
MQRVSDEQIGARIVRLREERGWNQGQLAAALRGSGLNWSQGTLSKVETGSRPVRLAEVPALADVLQIELDDLVDLDRNPDLLSETTRSALQDRLVDLKGARTNAQAIGHLADAVERLIKQTEGTISIALMHDSLANDKGYLLGEIEDGDHELEGE